MTAKKDYAAMEKSAREQLASKNWTSTKVTPKGWGEKARKAASISRQRKTGKVVSIAHTTYPSGMKSTTTTSLGKDVPWWKK